MRDWIAWQSANIQGRIGCTYDAAQDEATQGVFVPQSEVGQYGCLVLCYCIAVDRDIDALGSREKGENLLMEASNGR